jgi:hypothetical protein
MFIHHYPSKNIIKEKYKLNNLQVTLFKNFNESTIKYQILQCIGGAIGIKKKQSYSKLFFNNKKSTKPLC